MRSPEAHSMVLDDDQEQQHDLVNIYDLEWASPLPSARITDLTGE
jgi:hypothetical protein